MNYLKLILIPLFIAFCFGDFFISFGNIDEQFEQGSIEILISNNQPIGGFQLEFSGIEIDSVFGGIASDSGFVLTNSSNVVMGYSLNGTTFISDTLPLINLSGSFAGQTVCFDNVIISSSAGQAYSGTLGQCWESPSVLGCMDSLACNYSENATLQDNSCIFMEDNGWCDCDGNVIDCNGECGGSTFFDECGECGGDNSTCSGCTDPNAENYDPYAIVLCDDCCEYQSFLGMVVINEINYNPASTFGQDDANYEFIEFYNASSDSINLFNWKFSSEGGVNFTFPNYILEPDSYVLLARNSDTFPGSFDYGDVMLNNDGERLTLTDSNLQIVDVVIYSDGFQGLMDQWPQAADAEGSTLELIAPQFDNSLPQSWQASYVIPGGTPGYQNSSFGCLDPYACNYNPNVTISCDDCCEYPDFNYDCLGECIVEIDCNGVCGGIAELDECGVCNGSGPEYNLDCDGNCIDCGGEIISIIDIPDDQGGRVYIEFQKHFFDTDSLRNEFYSIERYDSNQWVNVISGSAYSEDRYVYEVPTLFNNVNTQFRVLSSMNEGTWASDSMSGTSLDNIAPPSPENLLVEVGDSSNLLSWDIVNTNDLFAYTLYKSLDSLAASAEIVAETTSNIYEDLDMIGDFYYWVSAFDVNGNESEFSSYVKVDTSNLFNESNPSEGYALLGCYPNPFNSIIKIDYYAPFLSDVLVEVYTITGIKIDKLQSSSVPAGVHSIYWNANSHSSGIYIVRMTTNSFTESQKIILVK